ncbi:CoA transferase [Iodidimonas sp. SYSU 1G8]|uniref:CaiB/BaiF CoA transferase family protein n=1 Tax=Iodidimonas sp. SYSU 1G8 TaxID=3133967 RepID=UPI0031FEDAF9
MNVRASSALSRFTVIDLTRARAGPTCARQLADWGADVIRVEAPPSAGEPADFASRHDPDFQNLHRNKRSLTLDLKAPDGVAVLRRLACKADVLIENYRPDVKRRLGIDYETLKADNPHLVYVSISGFGQDGPYADRPGLDQIAQGMGGMMSITGEAGRGPMRAGIAVSDMASGLLAANGTLTALLEREVSGEGQWVTTSLLESQIFMLDFQAARWLIRGEVPGQAGNDHPTAVPMGCFRTADGHVNMAPMPGAWAKFCKALGIGHLAAHPDFATMANRRANRALVNSTIEAVTVTRDSAYWIDIMNAAGIPCGPIYAIDQTFADPQVAHLGIAQAVASPALGEIRLVGQPVHLSRTDSRIAAAAPECGEHTDEILAWLEYSAADIAALRGANIV